MNYRNEIIDMTIRYVSQEYDLPAGSRFLAKAAEEVTEYWFEGDFEFDCGMDAQEAVGDYALAERVMSKYFQLEHEANVRGAMF
jgi:hypothetical protein